ncbi:MAG: hypothetical protein HQL64_00935 [Magnetococcales bacterium]|nr:hypothetical protein [Magnetococcales bacterium]
MAINLGTVSGAKASSEEDAKIREGAWLGRIWFPRRRSDGTASAVNQPEIWPRFSFKVAISGAGRMVADLLGSVGATVLDRVLRQQVRGTDLYGRDGQICSSDKSVRSSEATPAAASIWPVASSRVTLSDASRLASGVIANLETTPEEQDAFLQQIHEADRQGRFSGSVLAEARRLVQTFLSPETS